MRGSARLRFLWWFAWRDLLAGGGRRTTAVVLATLALLIASTVALYGLAFGFQEARLRRLQSDPLALCLWAEPAQLGGSIAPATFAELRTSLHERLPDPAALAGCFPFRETELDWVLLPANPNEPTRSTSLRGRTLAPQDPLLLSRPLRHGRPFAAPDAPGVIVTDAMLRALQAPLSPPPSYLRVRGAGGAPREVAVVGVTREDLPLGHYFVLTEAYEQRLLTEDPDPPADTVRTGPVPADWPPPERLPALRQAFETYQLLFPPSTEKVGDRTVWKVIALDSPGPSLSVWRVYLEAVRKLLAGRGFSDAPEFARVTVLSGPVAATPAPPRPYDRAAVYVNDLPHLRPAAEAVRAAGLRVDDDVIGQVESIGRATNQALALLLGVVLVVGLVAFWNTTVLQELRVRQKTAEIGMLKAMGMNDRLLRQVYLVEAALLWGVASLLGLGMGSAVGLAAAFQLAPGPDEGQVAFHCPWAVTAAVLGASGLACVGSTLLATRQARRAPPILSLCVGFR